MGDVRITQGRVFVSLESETPELRVSQTRALSAINFPTVQMRLSQARVLIAETADQDLQLSQARILVAARGRPGNPRLRDWTFSLDGHDYYVLRLGDDVTFVYDATTEQWLDWSDRDYPFWRANVGISWIGGTALGQNYGSNILVGDDNFGLLWILDPNQPYDENPDYLADEQRFYFERVAMGQVALRGRSVMPVYSAFLTADMGDPAYLGAGVTLFTSDDGGATFDDHGTVSVTPDFHEPELSWYSLGQAEAPGRLFKIVDDGAITRIDGLTVDATK
jgi:hypothetical protein